MIDNQNSVLEETKNVTTFGYPKMVEEAVTAISLPEVQQMIKRLSDFGLGVMLPHMHIDGEGLQPIPYDTIQMEDNLVVSFVKNDDKRLEGGYPVGWRWDTEKACVVGTCSCSGAPCKHLH